MITPLAPYSKLTLSSRVIQLVALVTQYSAYEPPFVYYAGLSSILVNATLLPTSVHPYRPPPD